MYFSFTNKKLGYLKYVRLNKVFIYIVFYAQQYFSFEFKSIDSVLGILNYYLTISEIVRF